jgi:two-component system response regulator DevR
MSQVMVGSKAIQNSDTSIKILLADDSEIVRRGIRQLLATQTGIEIVGEAASFAQTVLMVSVVKPEVIVLDLHMPGETNFSPQAVKSGLNHGSQLLAISLSNDEEAKVLAESFGASVLLDKMNLADTLIPSIVRLGQQRRSAVAQKCFTKADALFAFPPP